MKLYYDDGEVRIYHADALDFLRAVEAESVDFIFTDPPYGHNNNNGDFAASRVGLEGARQRVAVPIANDDPISTRGLVYWAFAQFARVLKKDGACCCCCCCGGGGPDPQFARWSLWLDELLTFKQMVIWDKRPTQGIGLGLHYRRSYETVLVAHRGAKCRWFDTTNSVENVIRDKFHNPRVEGNHPNTKPVAFSGKFIEYHTRPGDEVLDPFCGGGSTLIAAKLLGRKAVGVELEERWCELAANRVRTCREDYRVTP